MNKEDEDFQPDFVLKNLASSLFITKFVINEERLAEDLGNNLIRSMLTLRPRLT